MGETYLGCYIDASNDRDLPNRILEGDGNYKRCFELAIANGFRYAGLQYGFECWAGSAYGKYGKTLDSECNTECNLDKGKMCGGDLRNSVFDLTNNQNHNKDIQDLCDQVHI
jgi:hypothetical protein